MTSTIQLPGFGLPLDRMPKYARCGKSDRFPHAICDYLASDGVTRREMAMLEFMNQATDKPNWTKKVRDDRIVEKWRAEALGNQKQQDFSYRHMSTKCFDFTVFKRYLCGFSTSLRPWGTYQWLPSSVRYAEDGRADIESYVYNLHPQRHQDLYGILERAVEKAIPLWSDCSSFFHDRLRIKVEMVGMDDFRDPSLTLADLKTLRVADSEQSGEQVDDIEIDGNPVNDEDERQEWYREHADIREISQPDPNGKYVPFSDQIKQHNQHQIRLHRSVLPDGLQIIFKLANIHLTPEKPRYSGSEWHVEGALNEHICATALFYYDQENVEDIYLSF